MPQPSDNKHLADLINRLRVGYGANDKPIIVHCSAGIGRTGTLIVLFNLMNCVDRQKPTQPFVSVFDTVRKLRDQRFGAVQTSEQYLFIYRFILSYMRNEFSK